jgi:hypothetical protein
MFSNVLAVCCGFQPRALRALRAFERVLGKDYRAMFAS